LQPRSPPLTANHKYEDPVGGRFEFRSRNQARRLGTFTLRMSDQKTFGCKGRKILLDTIAGAHGASQAVRFRGGDNLTVFISMQAWRGWISASDLPNDFRISLRSIRATCLLLLAFSSTLGWALANDFAPFEEIWKRSQILEPKPSFDTKPVTLKVVSVAYRIPRNYLIYTDQIPTLKLTWPGLNPLTEETHKCFGSILQSEQAGCTSFEFHLLGSRGPAAGGRAFTNAEKFENFKKHTPNAKLRRGPFGYDVYDTGPEEARTETYRKNAGDILFHCSFSGEEGRKRGGVCNDAFRLDDMNHLQFYFRLHQIEYIPEIESRMRRLMATFVIEGGGNDINGIESFNPGRN
jgi:hypothetical protein